MASYTVVDLPSLTIANGTSTSGACGALDDAAAISIFAPATVTGTISLEVEPSSTGTSFIVQQSGGSDVTITANRATTLAGPPSFRQFRLTSNASEGGNRVFRITKTVLV